MYAIQSGSKFIKVDYYVDPNEVWNVVVTATPKTYKSRVVAERELQRMNEWLDHRIARAEEVIEGTEAFVAKNKKEVIRLEAKLEGLLDLPFREVEKKVEQVRKAIAKAGSEVGSSTPSIRSYKQDLARYQRIKSASAAVVLIRQTVEAL